LASAGLLSKNFDVEYEKCANLGIQPYMALEKDFLRFMLSDGASAVLLQDNPGKGKALHIEWVEMTSYANELPTCMFMGAEKEKNGELKSWKSFSSQELTDRSLFTVKQDIKLLEKNAVPCFRQFRFQSLLIHLLSYHKKTWRKHGAVHKKWIPVPHCRPLTFYCKARY